MFYRDFIVSNKLIWYKNVICLEDVNWWNYGEEKYVCMEAGGAGVWAVQGSKVNIGR